MVNKSASVNVTIRVSDAVGAAVEELERAGLKDVQAHERLKIVNGSIDRERIPELEKVQSVLSVREDRTYSATGS